MNRILSIFNFMAMLIGYITVLGVAILCFIDMYDEWKKIQGAKKWLKDVEEVDND